MHFLCSKFFLGKHSKDFYVVIKKTLPFDQFNVSLLSKGIFFKLKKLIDPKLLHDVNNVKSCKTQTDCSV